jgi:hypothetical protein
VQREARQEIPTKLVPTSVLQNLLKRPGTPLLEGVLTNKRAQLAKEDDDPTLEKTIVLPILKVLHEVYPRLGKDVLSRTGKVVFSLGTMRPLIFLLV